MHLLSIVHHTILPSTPSPSPLLALTHNDQIMPRTYISTLFFFPPPPPHLPPPAHSLKTSLQQALSAFYPLAGRFRERPDGGLDVDCRDQGVPFWETAVDARLDAFGADFQPNPDFQLLMPPIDKEAGIASTPILLVQLNHFKCGGICLGVASHHHVCDGVGFSHFMKFWAEIASGKGVSVHPHLDRSLLKARKPPFPSFDHIEYRIGKPVFPSDIPQMTAKIFTFTAASIKVLRDMIAKDESAVSYTSFECLAAHLWRCVTRARGVDDSRPVKLGMAVDGRKRFEPPLPEGFFGNVNFYACALSKARDLVEKPLAYGARCVHEAISRVTDEYMRSALDFIEIQESPLSVIPGFDSFLSSDIAITSWSRFPMYDVDFGWGKPTFAGIPAAAFDGLVLMLPSPLGAGNVNAVLGLAVEHMTKLESDAEFVL